VTKLKVGDRARVRCSSVSFNGRPVTIVYRGLFYHIVMYRWQEYAMATSELEPWVAQRVDAGPRHL
jgi:hypothetical protein